MGSSPISGRGFFLPGLCLLPRAPYQELQEAFALLRPPLSRTPPLDARCRVPLAVRWVDPGSISGGYLRRLSPRDAFGSRSSYSAFVGALARTRVGPRPWKSARHRALPVAPFERDAARRTHPDDRKTPPLISDGYLWPRTLATNAEGRVPSAAKSAAKSDESKQAQGIDRVPSRARAR